MPTWDDYRRWLGSAWLDTAPPRERAPELARLSTDTRTIGSGDWFVPLSGGNFDGHKFIGEALGKGASGFFYEAKRRADLEPTWLARGVAVTTPLEAFQKAASGWRTELRDIKILALTGSTGKTTTKEMLSGILRKAGETLATQASFNNEIGVPKTLAMLTERHRYAAVEMGARHKGNITFLCELVHPDVVGLLNVGLAHVGEFGSVQNLLDTKLEIFRDSPTSAICVASQDDERILKGAKARGKRVLSFGRAKGSDVRIAVETWNEDGTMTVALDTPSGRVDTRLGIAHEAFPVNAAAACAMSLAAGITPEHAALGLAGFAGIKGRFQVHAKGGLTIIDDTYNANPDSMRAGLTTLSRAYERRGKVVVLGDMLELGERSVEEHRSIGAFCARVANPELLVAVGQSAAHFLDGATAEGYAVLKTRAFANVDALLAARLPLADFGKVVYAKGSNGIKLSRLIEALLS
jgi:UDP-N-acetylmuramoyl-tripeptide--D-alanyl-D-alanine ligase